VPRSSLRAAAVAAALAVALAGGLASCADDTGSAASTTTSAGGSPSSTTTAGGAVDALVADLLPALTELPTGWAELSRTDPEPANPDPSAACPDPIATGTLATAEFHHLSGPQTGTILETWSITAGVVDDASAVPRLDDPAVADCLRAALAPSIGAGSPDAVTATPITVAAPAGATVTALRFAAPGTSSYELVLVQRDRVVASGLHVVPADNATPTPIDALVAALDGRLAAGQARL
jgi:hypothetical protein